MGKLHDKPRVSSRPSLYMLVEVAGGDYGGSNKSRFCKARVSVSSPSIECFELNLLADVAAGSDFYCSLFSGELTEVEKATRPRKLEMLAYVAALSRDKEYGGKENKSNTLFDEAKSIINCVNVPRKKRSLRQQSKSIINFVKVPRKKRSLRQQSSSYRTVATIRWIDCLIQPQNPNPSYSVFRKRGSVNVVSEEEEMRNRKKRKTVGRHRLDPTPTPTVPEWLVKVMAREGNGYDPKLIIARKLYKSDIDKGQARLSMPLKQVLSKDFLTEEEKRIIEEQSVTKSRSNGLSVVLVDPLLNKHKVDLRKWEMSGNWNYVFVDGWNDVVAKNKFEIGDVYPVWSFRSGGGKLCFALIPQSSDSGQGNSAPA